MLARTLRHGRGDPIRRMTTRVCSHWHVINGQSGPILTYGAIVSRSPKQLRLIESQYCRVCHNSLPRRNSEPCSDYTVNGTSRASRSYLGRGGPDCKSGPPRSRALRITPFTSLSGRLGLLRLTGAVHPPAAVSTKSRTKSRAPRSINAAA